MGRWRAASTGRLLAIGIAGTSALDAVRAEEVCAVIGAPAEVAVVLDDLELALDDGRVVRLAGIDPARATAARPGLAVDARAALDRLIAGRPIRVELLGTAPDRWDRVAALVGVADGTPSATLTLNGALIEAGWARVRPETLPRNCGSQFGFAEARARAGGVGLWADPYYAIVSGRDTEALAQRTGAMAVVEGFVSVRHEHYRTIVSFGPRIGRDLAVIVALQSEKRMAKAGLDLQKLVGREVRIRGFLDDRFGPRIDLVDPAQIEVVVSADQNRGAVRKSGVGSLDQNP